MRLAVADANVAEKILNLRNVRVLLLQEIKPYPALAAGRVSSAMQW